MDEAGLALSAVEGWRYSPGSIEWHYFVDDKPLCNRRLKGHWYPFADASEDDDSSSDNCKTCKKRLVRRRLEQKEK